MNSIRKRIYITLRLARQIGWNSVVAIMIRRALSLAKPVPIRIRGLHHQFFVRPTSDDLWVLLQIFDDQEYKRALTHRPNNVLDLGGNCGFTAIFLAHHLPDCKIVSVEPDSDNYSILLMNIKPYPNISAVNAAVWDTDCRVTLENINAQSSCKRFSESKTEDRIQNFDLEALSIPSISERTGVSFWDLIKIDVEGAEVRLLAAADTWIALTASLAIELHDFCASEALELLGEITSQWQYCEREGETYWCMKRAASTPPSVNLRHALET